MREVKQKLGRPDNSMFLRRFIVYLVILAVMIFGAPKIFEAIMAPMAASGMKGAWYGIFVPVVACMMLIGLFRAWRRRWSLAWVDWYKAQSQADGYEYCPRCGSKFAVKQRTRSSRTKVGEVVTTTHYSDGSTSTNTEDVYGTTSHTSTYHECTNPRCRLEPEQTISQSHLPWKVKQIRCLVLNDDRALNRGNTCAKHFLLSRLLIPFLAIVIVLAGAFVIYQYADGMSGEWTYTEADKQSSRSETEYTDYLLSLDTESTSWSFEYVKTPSDMKSYLSQLVLKKRIEQGFHVESYNVEGGNTTIFTFFGNDANTGLADGEYVLTVVDGINVLIDDENKLIYKQGTEFYDTYAPKLEVLTHDAQLGVILGRVSGGEHALSGSGDFWMEFVRKDNTMLYSYMLASDVTKINGGDLRAITTYPDEMMTEKWIFSYQDGDYIYTPDLEGFVYSDAMPDQIDDELGKLLKGSSDGTGSYKLFRNEEEVMDIDITTYPNGYEFEFDEAENGFEAETIYRINTNLGTLTKVTEDDSYNEIETDLPLAEHQDKFDFLMSIIPEVYIRSIIDLDKAEMTKESAGMVTVYTMKDESGNTVADMKVAFGKIGEVNHYISDTESIKVELAY